VNGLKDDIVRDFWKNEYDRYSPAFRAVVTAPLYNKVGALLTNPVFRRILTDTQNPLDLRRLLDDGNILLVNLDKGRIGEDAAVALGSFLVSHLSLAGLSRSDIAEEKRQDFLVFLDEFHTFATESLAVMLAELRKYRVACILAHQYLTQLDTGLRDAVFGNVGSIISFRISAQDAEFDDHDRLSRRRRSRMEGVRLPADNRQAVEGPARLRPVSRVPTDGRRRTARAVAPRGRSRTAAARGHVPPAARGERALRSR
jgi:hypothetical protein